MMIMRASEETGLLSNHLPSVRPKRPDVGSRSNVRVAVVTTLGMAAGLMMLMLASRDSIAFVRSEDRVYWDNYVEGWGRSLLADKMQLQATRLSVPTKQKLIDESIAAHAPLLYFNTSEAFKLVQLNGNKQPSSSTSMDFYLYQQGWEAQINQAFCAVASSEAVLNSLRGHIALPKDPIYDPYPWATQYQILLQQCARTKIGYNWELGMDEKTRRPRLPYGMGLEMARDLLSCHLAEFGYSVTSHHVNPDQQVVEDLRITLVGALQNPDARVIINYDRGAIGQGPYGHGHFSPLGAYSMERDSFLIMDVAKYKHPAVWVSSEQLVHGMATNDSCGKFFYPKVPLDWRKDGKAKVMKALGCKSSFRGFIIVQKM